MNYNIHDGAIPWQIYDFPFVGSGNVCSFLHHLWDIHCQKFELENDDQVEKGTGTIKLQMFESI